MFHPAKLPIMPSLPWRKYIFVDATIPPDGSSRSMFAKVGEIFFAPSYRTQSVRMWCARRASQFNLQLTRRINAKFWGLSASHPWRDHIGYRTTNSGGGKPRLEWRNLQTTPRSGSNRLWSWWRERSQWRANLGWITCDKNWKQTRLNGLTEQDLNRYW